MNSLEGTYFLCAYSNVLEVVYLEKKTDSSLCIVENDAFPLDRHMDIEVLDELLDEFWSKYELPRKDIKSDAGAFILIYEPPYNSIANELTEYGWSCQKFGFLTNEFEKGNVSFDKNSCILKVGCREILLAYYRNADAKPVLLKKTFAEAEAFVNYAREGVLHFMTESLSQNEMMDIMAHIFTTNLTTEDSGISRDLLRSIFMNIVRRFLTENIEASKILHRKGLILDVSGELSRLLGEEGGELTMAVIDGLGLQHNIDLRVHTQYSYFQIEGILGLLNLHVKPIDALKYIPLKIDGMKVKGTSVVGKVVYEDEVEKQFFLTVGDIRRIDLSGAVRLNIMTEDGVVFAETGKDQLEIDTAGLKGMIIDSRRSPVIYGPSYERNRANVLSWVSGAK